MEILTREQALDLPLDVVRQYNSQWREAIRQHDKGWPLYILKYPNAVLDHYIIKKFPELAFQFKLADMDTNQRLQARFDVDFNKCYDE
jgi:hypothetical protein